MPPVPWRFLASVTSERSFSSSFGISIFTGHTSAHAPHRLDANGSQPSFVDAVKLRRDDRADRSRINPRIIVPADLAVHRAMIQTSAAADAIKRLALLGIAQQLGSAVVEQHHVKLVRAVDFARAPRSGEKRRVHRERLAGGAASQQVQKHGQILRARNHLFDARDGDVDLRRRTRQTRVAFVLHHHHRARIRHQEIRARDADIGLQKFLAQHRASDLGLILGNHFFLDAQLLR